MNRRDFLQTTAGAAAAGLILPRGVSCRPAAAKPRRVGPDRGGLVRQARPVPPDPGRARRRGRLGLRRRLGDAQGRRRADRPPASLEETPRTYTDYRAMLAEQDLDLVLVDTPDHWHALPMIAAVEAGADIYVQKPISIDVLEGQAMVDAARKHGQVVQVGTQRRSTPHLIEARDRIIREGKLGKIGLVEVYCYYHMRSRGNPPDTAPPSTFDYEMWTGPAPMRPYNSLVHPRTWRAFNEYSNGILGDMCVHMLDMVRWMLGLGWPKHDRVGGRDLRREGA